MDPVTADQLVKMVTDQTAVIGQTAPLIGGAILAIATGFALYTRFVPGLLKKVFSKAS